MHSSIASRVTIVCTALLAVSLLIVLQCYRAGRDLHAANVRSDLLIGSLRAQDEADSLLRQLRQSVGDTTRDVEQGRTVSDARWRELAYRLREFAAISDQPDPAAAADPPPAVQRALAGTRAAASAFVPACGSLIEVARTDPAGIKPAMPRFLQTLRVLETTRTDTREQLGQAIERATDSSLRHAQRSGQWLLGGALGVILMLLTAAAWLRWRVIAPITRIAARLRAFGSAQPDERPIPGLRRPDELGDLARGLSEYRRTVEEWRAAQRRIDFLAHHDALTGLPNRLLFENRLTAELARRRRTGHGVALLAIDMDGFKEINDRHGHAGGDAALRRTAQLLLDAIRADDLVARMGGDEFAIIQAGSAQPDGAQALLARLAAATARSAGDPVPVRMSIGVAIAADDDDADTLYNAADIALYRAKAAGGDTARFYDLSLQEEIRLERRLARDLEQAVERGEMDVVYQPIATARRRIIGYEALLRWHHPELGEVSPTRFIPVAEASGRIGAIGRWMAGQAIATAARFGDGVLMSINLSPIQFRDADLADALLALASQHAVSPRRLVFEVTESATLLGHDRVTVLATLRRLQDAGAMIAMDDFGTGHSSLSNLKDFRFDKIKIDRSFVAAMLDDASSASIIRATIGLGRSLGAVIVAEGVEHEAQFEQLQQWGCDRMQGYLIGVPMPADAHGVGTRSVASVA